MRIIINYVGVSGCLIIAGAIFYSIWSDGMEATSWVATTIGTLLLLGSTLWNIVNKGKENKKSGDDIRQRKIQAGGSVTGKRSRQSPSQDKIVQEDITTNNGDVIGKDEYPSA